MKMRRKVFKNLGTVPVFEIFEVDAGQSQLFASVCATHAASARSAEAFPPNEPKVFSAALPASPLDSCLRRNDGGDRTACLEAVWIPGSAGMTMGIGIDKNLES
jgi:hypothetical protein